MRVLLVEDDAATAASIELMLRKESFICDTTDLGEDGLEIGKLYDYDIIILDLLLPDIDGYEVLRQLRASGVHTPVLVLSARTDLDYKLKGLGFGADEFMTKPFEPRELILRIGNILKRTAPPPVTALEQVAFGPYVYHLDRGELRQGDEAIHLTDREREMLRILAVTPGETVPRSALTGEGSVNERAVDVQINRLRRKIERDPANPLFLQAVRGIGYRLVASP